MICLPRRSLGGGGLVDASITFWLVSIRPIYADFVDSNGLGLLSFTALDSAAKIDIVKRFTLEYWKDDGWYVGRLKKCLPVMSQGENTRRASSHDPRRLPPDGRGRGGKRIRTEEKQELSISQ